MTIVDWPRARAASFPFLLILVAFAQLGCGGGKECAVDTDCRFRERCSEDNKCIPIGGDAEPTDAAVSDGGDDAGSDAGEDAGVDAGPGVIGAGSVTAISQAFGPVGAEVPSYSVSAGFAFDDGEPDPCSRVDMGACNVIECPDTTPPPMDAGTGDAGVDAAMPPALPTAGTIQVTGLEAVTLMPDASGLYTAATGTVPLWDRDTMLTIQSGLGADVPVFNESMSGVQQVVVTGPALTGLVDRGSDLAFSWMGTSQGEVVVRMTAAGMGTAFTTVECRFDPVGLAGTVPAAALASFDSGSMASISVNTENVTTVEDAGWTITLTASAGAKVGDSPAVGTLTFN